MEAWGYGQRLGYGVLQCAGLGLLAGAFEAVGLAATLKLPLSVWSYGLLGIVAALVMAAVAMAMALPIGAVVHLADADDERNRDVPSLFALQAGFVAAALSGFYLWQAAFERWVSVQEPVGALAMAVMPIGFAGVIYFNARYLFRRIDRGLNRNAWLGLACLVSVVVVGLAAVTGALRERGGGFALEGDDNLVLVTVDSLRRDSVGLYASNASTPHLDELGNGGGVVFDDAITPTPGTRSANATVLFGLHPLRHRVLSDRDVASRRFRSLFEVLAAEGWATAGFVSDRQVGAGSGLDQGLHTFDDDFEAIPGIGRVNLIGHLLRVVGTHQGRAAHDTVDRFAQWLAAESPTTFAAWVHLKVDESAGVEGVDDAVGRLREVLERSELDARTVVVVVGSHGTLLGAHGGDGNRTLHDEVLRVPFVVRAPGLQPAVAKVGAQVRLMDVASTALTLLQLDSMEQSEGLSLHNYIEGTARRTISCTLVGQDLQGQWWIGLRNNGVKYLRDAQGRERMYDLADDPGEQVDIAKQQSDAVAASRSLLASDIAAMETTVWR